MVERKTPGERVLQALVYILVTFVGFVCLYPMLHVVSASLSDPMLLLRHRGALFFPDDRLDLGIAGRLVIFKDAHIFVQLGVARGQLGVLVDVFDQFGLQRS